MDRWKLLLLVCALFVCTPSVLSAQADPSPPATGAGGAAAPAAPVIVPPKLDRFIEAVYPPEALEQCLSARVEIEMVVGLDGHVSNLKVKGEPAGHGFDEAALAAAQQLTFAPATRDGKPVAAR